ncbi:MAG: type IV pilus biogenesis/stability protein PilW [Gammaproteobacteria bacterium]|nr:type IV pilus biogenesis/stability protein PilW [Gammaproteobacteria bacterium]
MHKVFWSALVVLLSACVSVDERKGSPEQIADVNVALAKQYYAKGLYDIAEEKLNKALSVEPDSVSANTLLALIYDQQGLQEKAGAQFRTTLDLVEDNSVEFAEVHNNYAIFLCKNGKWPEAEVSFKKAIDVKAYQTKAEAMENAGLCALNAKDYENAGRYFETALKHNNTLLRAQLGLAKVKAQIGDWQAVRRIIEDFHRRAGTNEESLYLIAKASGMLNDTAAKKKYTDMLAQSFPKSEYLQKLEN